VHEFDALIIGAGGASGRHGVFSVPSHRDPGRTYLGLDPAEAPIPVQPTAHYAMGGIPTDNEGRVLADGGGKGPHGGRIREEMRELMMQKVGIYRKEKDMQEAVAGLLALRDRYREVRAQDGSKRYNPDTDSAPYFKDYPLEVEPTDRVLDALMHVKSFIDGSLAFRKSCAHGVCGSDGMIINGQERLACKTLVKDVAGAEGAVVIKVEPMKHLPLQRDLMVQQDEFFARWRKVKPFLINEESIEERERVQSPEERALFDDPTRCILCASCYSACPILDNTGFIGPAAIAQAARFLFDSRDRGFAERLDVLDHADGVWACENHFQCTRVCPRGIKITKNINLTKRRITKEKEQGEVQA